MNTIQNHNATELLERSRTIILNFGYDLIAHKSRVKKALTIFKGRLQNNRSHFKNTFDSKVSMIASPTK